MFENKFLVQKTSYYFNDYKMGSITLPYFKRIISIIKGNKIKK